MCECDQLVIMSEQPKRQRPQKFRHVIRISLTQPPAFKKSKYYNLIIRKHGIKALHGLVYIKGRVHSEPIRASQSATERVTGITTTAVLLSL